MNTKRQIYIRGLLLSGAVTVTAAQLALAAAVPPAANNYTKACTTITNTAVIAYKVNGAGQLDVNSNNGSCTILNGCAFVVGNKINQVIQSNDAANVTVIPASTNQQLSFLLTNTGNARQKYLISYDSKTGGLGPFGGTDSFNMNNPGVSATSTLTFTTAVVDPDTSVTVTVNADTPNQPANGDLAVYAILAEARKVDGSAETANNGSGTIENSTGTTCTADIVYADPTPTAEQLADGDLLRDAKVSARGAYSVSSAVLSFSKTATTIWDPINGNNSPKAIPGALIRYTATVSNAALAATATITNITDSLASNMTLDHDLKIPAACLIPPCTLASLANESGAGKAFKVIVAAPTRANHLVPLYYTDTVADDGVNFVDPLITLLANIPLPVEGAYLNPGELKQNESLSLIFNVVVK